MARRVNAIVDGVPLNAMGPITIQQVSEPAPEMNATYGARPGRSGKDIISYRRGALSVTLEATINELYDLKKRADVLQAIAGWANGSILELSNHAGQQLHVKCKSFPSLGEVREYTQNISIGFEAAEIPYWEDKVAVTASGTDSSGSIQLFIPGTADEIPVEATFTPGSTLTTLAVTVSCGGVTRSISLSGMSLGSAVKFTRIAGDRLQIVSGSTNLLRYRSAASADDLVVPAGKATITWSANTSGTLAVSTKGRWL